MLGHDLIRSTIDRTPVKIMQARAYVCDLPVSEPRLDAVQSFSTQETIIVELRGETGLVGRGYSYTIGTGGSAVCALLRSHLLEQVVGEDTTLVEACWRRLREHTRATTVGVITSLALAAVDTAVWDLRGKELGLPLWALAGGAQTSVPVYDTEGGWLQHSEQMIVAHALRAKSEGMGGVKIKIGKPAAEDLRRVSAVREAIGPDMALMVDANQCFTVDEARRRARMLEPLDIAWFEEPLPAEDITGHAELARGTAVPLAVGESIYSVAQFRSYLEARAAAIVQVDVARIGGVTPWLKVAHLSEAFNVIVAPHFLMELHVSLASAVPNARWIEWIPQLAALTERPIDVIAGAASPPKQAGIGIAWSTRALAAHCTDATLATDPPWVCEAA
jgi:L-alanine-DL-glutamate epimerase-like enolase superfamily enzyme